MLSIFDLAFPFYMALGAPKFFWAGKHRHYPEQRWGKVHESQLVSLRSKQLFWLHGVSIGEARIACHLATEMAQLCSSAAFMITTSTISGRVVAEKFAPKDSLVIYFPWDLSWVMRRFIESTKPVAALVIETEFWPNFLRQLEQHGIPAFIVNGRISKRSYGMYRFARCYTQRNLNKISLCFAQSEKHCERFIGVGMPKDKVLMTGNMKYDLLPDNHGGECRDWFTQWKEREKLLIWFCSSTHQGEELLLYKAYRSLRADFPNLRLIMAPRHIGRVAALEKRLRAENCQTQRLSLLKVEGLYGPGDFILLVDQWGVYSQLYACSDVVFVGRSLVCKGGQNIVEPALWQKAICHGPFMENFSDIASEFQKHNAAILIPAADPREIAEIIAQCLRDQRLREALGRAAHDTVLRNRGATRNNIEMVLSKVLKPEPKLSYK